MAQALGRALREEGFEIACVASRSLERAAAAAAFIGGAAIALPLRDVPKHASDLLIAVSDTAIAPVAGELAAAEGTLRLALHTSGNYGPEVLHALAEAGVSCGAIHPLQTVHDPQKGAADLRGIRFAISGDPEAVRWAETMAKSLGGEVLRIPAECRQLYHAAAVMASNYITALLDAAQAIMTKAGLPQDQALRALAPLTRASVENAVRYGPRRALTGPIVRGDALTVAAHVRALEPEEQALADLYKAAGARTLQMARASGLSEEAAGRVAEALRGEVRVSGETRCEADAETAERGPANETAGLQASRD
jgi:predicted short-subunit dehydrogenase-like oxidoreductase (DUF2520 family)